MTLLNPIRGLPGLNDRLIGTDGNDDIDGGTGADTMSGGKGDDTYTVDDAKDVIDESTGDGIDTVVSSRDFNLNKNGTTVLGDIENLTFTGDKDRTGYGNDLHNIMKGGDGRNMLYGNGGNDTLIGGKARDYLIGGVGDDRMDGGGGGEADHMSGGMGDDTYVVDNAWDFVVDGRDAGNDTIEAWISYNLFNNNINIQGDIENLTLMGDKDLYGIGTHDHNIMNGNIGENILYGYSGNDRLDGRRDGKADRLIGGADNDTYVIGELIDIIEEEAGLGIDTVEASISYKLEANLENLVLTGHDDIDGRGNNAANIITGNDGDNRLDGGKGADRLIGGKGNDRYVVDDAGDVIDETDGHGADSGSVDTVRSSISFSLEESATVLGQFENLALFGTESVDATGNALSNRITGNDGDNTINGGLGRDTLIGGWGEDHFVFNTALGDDNVDRILDFSFGGADKIGLDSAIFTALTRDGLSDSNILNTQDGGATTAGQHLLYNSKTGQLFYDEDGAGGKEAVLFAELDRNMTLHASDFYVM